MEVTFEIDGTTYSSAVRFVGVGERSYRVPMMGEPKDHGRGGSMWRPGRLAFRCDAAALNVRVPVSEDQIRRPAPARNSTAPSVQL